MPRLFKNSCANLLAYACVPVALWLLLTRCWHTNTGSPITVTETAVDGKSPLKVCKIVCLDCGASADYDPLEFRVTTPWEKVRPVAKKEIKPHVYSNARCNAN
jgi:hypothetical protein